MTWRSGRSEELQNANLVQSIAQSLRKDRTHLEDSYRIGRHSIDGHGRRCQVRS